MPDIIAFDIDASARPDDRAVRRAWRLLAELDRLDRPWRVLAYTHGDAPLTATGRLVAPVRVGPAALRLRVRTDRPALLHTLRPLAFDPGCPTIFSPSAADGTSDVSDLGPAPSLFPLPPHDAGDDAWRAAAVSLAALYDGLLARERARSVSASPSRPRSLVAASVVSTGEASRLTGCLRSLEAQGFGEDLRVVVVCNQPGDGSAALVRAAFPQALVVEQRERRGFGRNHNTGLATVDAEFGLVLNPDVEIAPGGVAALLDVMRAEPRCGLVAPELVFPDGRPQPSARRFPEPLGTLVRRTPLRGLFPPQRFAAAHYLPRPDAPRRIDWSLGACLLARTSAWREVGGFDEDYDPLYVEDIDLAWRLWQRGWEVWQTPTARAIHEHQAASDKTFLSRRTLWHWKGMRQFVRKHPTVLAAYRPALAEAASRAG